MAATTVRTINHEIIALQEMASFPLCGVTLPAHLHEPASALHEAAGRMTADQARRVLELRTAFGVDRGQRDTGAGWVIGEHIDSQATIEAIGLCDGMADERRWSTWVERACGNVAHAVIGSGRRPLQ